MFNIKTINNISSKGLERLPKDNYAVSADEQNPQAIILRSHKMHDDPIADSLIAVGRAGAGVNNVPVEKMSKKGIPVFNAPGANANAVKELVIAGMLLAARNICQAWDYTAQVDGSDEELNKAVEAGKKQYVGFELPGRTLGVIGLGAIGVEIANAACTLGMNVVGFDPLITVKSAWKLSSDVQEMDSVDELLKVSDFVTFHVPLVDGTRNLINATRLASMPDNAVILNFARQGIVDDEAVLESLKSGKIHAYVCDFPSNTLKGVNGVITLPHLGASTKEAEENCVIMIADQLRDYLENGNIHNSVNFPEVKLARSGKYRLAVANENQPDMLGQISHVLGSSNVNICHMINESRNDIAYTLIDTDSEVSDTVLSELQNINGVLGVRLI